MKYFVIFVILSASNAIAGEHSLRIYFPNINVADIKQRIFHTIPATGTSIAHELTQNNVTFSINSENKYILLRGDNKQSVNTMRNLIQNHILP